MSRILSIMMLATIFAIESDAELASQEYKRIVLFPHQIATCDFICTSFITNYINVARFQRNDAKAMQLLFSTYKTKAPNNLPRDLARQVIEYYMFNDIIRSHSLSEVGN